MIAGSNVHYGRYSFRYFVETQAELGLTQIELWGSTPHLWCNHLGREEGIDEISRLLYGSRLAVSAFAPRPYGYSLFSEPGSALREATLSYYRKCIEIASRLQSRYLCLVPIGDCADTREDALWARCSNALHELCKTAKSHGVAIVIGEASPQESRLFSRFEALTRLRRGLSTSGLKFFLDTSRLGTHRENIAQWFEKLGEDIAFVRFVDSRWAGPRVWGEGCLPAKRLWLQLSQAGYTGPLVMHLSGDRYQDDPAAADRRNVQFLKGLIGEGK